MSIEHYPLLLRKTSLCMINVRRSLTQKQGCVYQFIAEYHNNTHIKLYRCFFSFACQYPQKGALG